MIADPSAPTFPYEHVPIIFPHVLLHPVKMHERIRTSLVSRSPWLLAFAAPCERARKPLSASCLWRSDGLQLDVAKLWAVVACADRGDRACARHGVRKVRPRVAGRFSLIALCLVTAWDTRVMFVCIHNSCASTATRTSSPRLPSTSTA